jgi:signal transduction histidine kinase
LEEEPAKIGRLKEMLRVVGETLMGIRRISRDLRPLMLEDLGLIPALQSLIRAAREGIGSIPHIHLEVSQEPVSLSPEHELAIYRIIQEALNNIRKHAEATGVQVRLVFGIEGVTFEIEDNGKGFQLPKSLAEFTQCGNFGLMGIQERVWSLGGKLSIQSDAGRGTSICIKIPNIS